MEAGKNFFTDSAYAKRLIEFQCLGAEQPGARLPIPSRVPLFDDSVATLPDGTLMTQYEPRKVVWISSKDIVQYRLKEG